MSKKRSKGSASTKQPAATSVSGTSAETTARPAERRAKGPEAPVVIVGAGMAGLCCALSLQAKGAPHVVLDAADAPGGRVRTDVVDGYRLDRGFQVLLTAYPEVKRFLDLKDLDLHLFQPGALVRCNGRLHRLVDPFRQPWAAPGMLASPVGTLKDKLLVATLRRHVRSGTLKQLLARPETSTLEAITRFGFSERMIEAFFRPFLGGIFLEPELKTSSRLFELVFRMFAEGRAALPAAGMGAIGEQLAARLDDGVLRLGCRVEAIDDHGGVLRVRLAGGEEIRARAVVVAVEAHEAARLVPELKAPGFHSAACLYYTADHGAIREIDRPVLVLNGDGRGPIDTLCVPSAVAPGYAPDGRALVSVQVLGDASGDDVALERAVREQLSAWFGTAARLWTHLRTYHIRHALPARQSLEPVALPVRRRPGLYLCGDHRDTPSLNGAMASGRRAAAAVLEDWTKL